MRRFDLEAVQEWVADLVDESSIGSHTILEWEDGKPVGREGYRFLHLTIEHDEPVPGHVGPAATIRIWEQDAPGQFDRIGGECCLTPRVWTVIVRISELIGGDSGPETVPCRYCGNDSESGVCDDCERKWANQ